MLADLASSLASRDPSTAAHCSRVTFLAGRLAMWLGWDERELCALEAGASVHDIGKVTLSQDLLAKRGPLQPHELDEIRTHPEAGARLIDPVGPARDALPYVLYHHERWDGGGYPMGLARTEIPAGARLLAVADAFDAMTSTRPYRQALPVSRALLEVKRCAGTQFDPLLAEAFLDAWDAGFLQAPAAALG
jgi:HD-GYP domain-containing protein (c-di-GMP phosphodiesterase class II)